MVVDIRPDMCLALRMIALQEYHRKQMEFVDEIAKNRLMPWWTKSTGEAGGVIGSITETRYIGSSYPPLPTGSTSDKTST